MVDGFYAIFWAIMANPLQFFDEWNDYQRNIISLSEEKKAALKESWGNKTFLF